jgi:hypothetical protein
LSLLAPFQIFALGRKLDFDIGHGRSAVADAMSGHVLAKDVLRGTCERPRSF